MDKLKKIYSGEEVDPISIEIRPTDLCNLNCKFCYNNSLRISSDFSSIKKDYWISLMQSIEKNDSLKNIILNGGGEPLMYPRILLDSLFKVVKERNILITIVTNGTLLGKWIIDALEDNHCLLNISIKSIDRNGFYFITGKDLYERQMNNLNSLLFMRRHAKNRLIIARYVFAEPINSEFNVELFAYFLMKLFDNGLDAFLITFSNPLISKKSKSYNVIYKKINKNRNLAALLNQGYIRFSNLRYLSGDYPDVCSSYSDRNTINDINYLCYLEKIFLIVNQYGQSNCLHNLYNKKNIFNNDFKRLNSCHSCAYYNYNNNITMALEYFIANGIKKPLPNDFINHVLQIYNGLISNDEFTDMKKFVKYITSSQNPVIQGLPFVLH